ncbi:MAG TPA: T3SS effector HopA1 family protein [Desulfobacterales bacterium]|jgi:hypothetical protein|nr:T3SS effector HopA1 family protein [Desulfobacterales bacterium]
MHPDLQAFIVIVWNNLGRLRRSNDIYHIYGRHGFVDNQCNDQNLKKYKDVVSREMKNIEGFIIDMRDVSTALAAAEGDDRIQSWMQTGGRVWDGQPTTRVLQHFESGYPVTEELAGAFYHFDRDLPVGRTGPQQVRHRLYIALHDGNYRRAANTIVGALLQALKEIDAIVGFHKFKAMGPFSAIVEGRRDHIVAYFNDQKSRKTVTNRIIAMAQKDRKLAAGPLPFCIEKQAEGIGWADEPPGNTSYGSYLATAIWKAVEGFDPDDKSPQARDTFHQAALWQFAKFRIDPERPWANIGTYQPPPQKERPAAAIRPATHAATRAATNAAGANPAADRRRLMKHRRRAQALAPADDRPAPQDPGGEGRAPQPPPA